jgi:hypothetical protein
MRTRTVKIVFRVDNTVDYETFHFILSQGNNVRREPNVTIATNRKYGRKYSAQNGTVTEENGNIKNRL